MTRTKGGGPKPHDGQGHCWHGNGRHGPGSRFCCICRPDLNGQRGGGRESGGQAQASVSEPRPPDAAANSAAPKDLTKADIERILTGRILALEAELAAYKETGNKAWTDARMFQARVEKAEADLRESDAVAKAMQARIEKAESDGRLLGKMLDAQNEKLHSAEARVKELTKELEVTHTRLRTTAADRDDLRGEDSG